MKEFIKDSLRLINISGLNPYCRSNLRLIITLYAFVSIAIGMLLDLLFNWKGKSSIPDVTDLIALWQGTFKLLVLLINNNKFANILHKLDDFWPADKYGSDFQKQMEISHNQMEKFLKGWKATYLILIITYISKPIITRSKTLLVRTNYVVIDVYADPIFQIMYIEQVLCCFLGIGIVVGFDLLFTSLIFYIIRELKFVKKGFLSIPIHIDPNRDKGILGNFKQLVWHHGKVLSLIEDIGKCYSMLLLNQFLTSTFCVCGALLVLSSDNSGEIGIYIVYLVTYLTQIFFYCLGGSYVVTESTSVADTLYDMQWWVKTQPELRKAMVLAIMRSHKEVKLKGGGMFNLNLTSFTSIVRTGISFFTLFRTVYSNSASKSIGTI